MYCGTLKIIKYGKHLGKNEEKLQPIFWMIPILDTRSTSSTSRVLPGVRIIAKWGQVSQLTLRWSKFADGRSSIVEGRQTDNRTLENWRDI